MSPFQDLLRNFRCGLRLATLRRVTRGDFVASTEAYALLVVAHLAILVVLGYAYTGQDGQLNYFELPRALMAVPLTLAFGFLVERGNRDSGAMLLLAVALFAAGTTLTVIIGAVGLLAQGPLEALRGHYWHYLHYLTLAWWSVVLAAAVLQLTSADFRHHAGNITAGLMLLVLPGWLLPQGYLWVPKYGPHEGRDRPGLWALAEEAGFYAQQEMLSKALDGLQPERRGVPDIYLVAAGLYASEDVFMKEVRVIETLFRERFDAEGRVMALVNNPQAVQQYPVASLTSLSASLRRVGSLMNPEEDILVLYVSSHGSETHQLSVDFWPLRLNPIDPPALKQALDQSGIKWKVIVVSACYSGGFIGPLKDDNSLIITASSASKQSFGCGNESESTYLAKALFDEALRATYSFEQAFEAARKSIAQREREQNFTPSEPQIHVGGAMRGKLRQVESRLAVGAVDTSN